MWPPSPAVGFHFPSRHFESAKHLCACWVHLSDYSHDLGLSAISQAANSRVPWTSHGPPPHPPGKMQPLASRLFCCLPLALQMPLGTNPPFKLQLSECRRLPFMVPIGFGTQIFPKGIYLLSPRANYKYTKTLETLYLNFMKQVRPPYIPCGWPEMWTLPKHKGCIYLEHSQEYFLRKNVANAFSSQSDNG